MITFRIVQRVSNQHDQHHIELTLEEMGSPRQTASVLTDLSFTEQEQEDLRWYLEEYLSYPVDPAPEIAHRVERQMAEIGIRLFETILQSNGDARDIWATLRPRLGETRIEVVTEVKEASSIPWELLRDSKTDTPLLLSTRSFVRAHPTAAQPPKLPGVNPDALRILLVICRPGGAVDVPFRSVAGRIVRSLT